MLRSLLFTLIMSLPFALFAQENNDFLLDFRSKWSNATAYSMEVLNSMPAKHFVFKPTPEIRSFGEQMNHTLQNIMWLSSTYLSVAPSLDIPESATTKKELLSLAPQVFAYAQNALEGLAPHDLRTEVHFFAGPMSRRKILLLLNDHLTHHRGQMIIYLRLKGIEPPRYRGW